MALAIESEAWERYPANGSRDGEGLEFNAMDSLRRLEDPEGIYFLEEGLGWVVGIAYWYAFASVFAVQNLAAAQLSTYWGLDQTWQVC